MVSEATQTWFKELVRDTQQRMTALSSLQDEPEQFYGRVERDGVTVVVAPAGSLVDLELNHTAMRLGPHELAALILRNQREAVEQANRQYAAAVQEAAGPAVDVNALVERRIDAAALREAAADMDGDGR